MADEDQRDAREADVARADCREAEPGERSNDSRHEQMDSCICSEGIRFLEALRGQCAPQPELYPGEASSSSRSTSSSTSAERASATFRSVATTRKPHFSRTRREA